MTPRRQVLPRSRRDRRRRSRRRRDRVQGGDRRDRRFRLLRLPRAHRDCGDGDAVRGARRADHDRLGGRPDGRLPPPPRDGPSVPAAQGPVSSQHVGAEGPRRDPGVRAVRGGISSERDPAADTRRQRPGDRLHEVPIEHVLRRAADHSRVVRRPVLPHPPRDAGEDRRVGRDRAPGRRHDGRDRGAEVLDEGGVADVRAARGRRDRDDPVPGGDTRARARALLRERGARDRLRRRRGRHPTGHARGGPEGLRREHRQAPRPAVAAIPAVPAERTCPCATALAGTGNG